MLIEFPYAQRYLFTALHSAPDVFDRLLDGLTPAEADYRPDADRFTIREVIAHLAEWEPIFLERIRRICQEEVPLLEGYDEEALAIEHDYAHSDVWVQARLFRERREELVTFLQSLTPEQWHRLGNRPEIGMVSIEGIALLIPLHDTYHANQIGEYRGAIGNGEDVQ